MKKLLLFLLLGLGVTGLSAKTDYNGLWKAVEESQQKDLPQSSLATIAVIRKAATAEHNMPHLCRALFLELQCKKEISPDSIEPCKDMILKALQEEKRPVERALYSYLYYRISHRNQYYVAAMADMPLLARTKTDKYLPLVDLGKDSKWLFNDDLLSLMVESEDYKKAVEVYEKLGNERAAWYFRYMIRRYENNAKLYPDLRAAMDKIPSLKDVTPIARYIAGVEQQNLRVQLRIKTEKGYVDYARPLYPGEEVYLVAEAKNLKTADLKVGDKSYTMRFKDVNPWESAYDTLKLKFDEPCCLKISSKIGKEEDKTYLRYSRIKPIFFRMSDGRTRVALVDAKSGAFVPNASLERHYKGKSTSTFKPAADGFIYLTAKDVGHYGDDWLFTPKCPGDEYCDDLDSWTIRNGNEYRAPEKIDRDMFQIFTDRDIYRPGQKLEVSVLSYTRLDDDYKVQPDDSLRFILKDTKNRLVEEKSVKTDAFGVARATFQLPENCQPGRFSMQVNRGNSSVSYHTVRVEEYKRPTFLVEFDPMPERKYVEGDTVRFSGTVRTYNGIPMFEARVVTDLKDTLLTDEKGRFSFVRRARPNGDSRWWHGMQVSVDVLGSNGESHSASAFVYVIWNKPKEEKKEPTFWERIQDGDMLFRDVVVAKNTKSSYLVYKKGMTFDDEYKPEYGDGANIHYAFVRDFKFYHESKNVKKPEPKKAMSFKWSTFRSTLVPGQKETWTLQVTDPDGKPAKANVMARLYDATLDAFASNCWGFSLGFSRTLPYCTWGDHNVYAGSVSLEGPNWAKDSKDLNFTQWYRNLFSWPSGLWDGRPVAKAAMVGGGVRSAMQADNMVPMEEASEQKQAAPAPKTQSGVQIRENFNETAFFMPQLRTNAKGETTMTFTLPESLTQWNFTAFAHDKNLNYGIFNDTIVARKQLQAELALPRFLREGDKTMLPVTLTNLSEKTQNVNMTLEVFDAKSNVKIAVFKETVTLAKDQRQTFSYPYETTDKYKGLRFRVIAKSKSYSDGEEREIPVLSNRVDVVRTIPFSMLTKGDRTLRLDTLWVGGEQIRYPELTLKMTRNPEAQVIEALKPVLDEKCEDAIAWAIQLYCSQVANRLYPGVCNAESYKAKAIKGLSDLQLPSGGWSWYTGMSASEYTTLQVATLLVRLQELVGMDEEYQRMLKKALPYLRVKVAEDIAWMKKHEGMYKHPIPVYESMYHYLYVCAMMDVKADNDMKYILDKIEASDLDLTMYGKAGCSIVLRHYGRQALADQMLQSLVEHTVTTEEMGRYFDTRRALGGWRSYKIPTQTFSIEALSKSSRESREKECEEMRLWLLQSKRTQKWETSLATTDACWALLNRKMPITEASKDSVEVEKYEGDKALKLASLTVNNHENKLIWGSVIANYELPTELVPVSASGITVTRQIKKLKGDEPYRVGDRVRITYTIKLDRDMDFVSLTSSRAACMEPLRSLSGYDWETRAYRSVSDKATNYYFEHLAKGTHTMSEDFYLDREGTYNCGIATAECVYAPEYSGQTSGQTIVVEK